MASPTATTPEAVEAAPRHMYALTLEYDGTAYSGWQRQPGRRTVEGALLAALVEVCGERPALTAAGRTDAGAHAHGQVVGCPLQRAWEPDRLRAALNAHLPEDVVVVAAELAPPGFHARFDAIARTYRYVIEPRRERPAVGRQYAWHVRGDLDIEAMRAAAATLVGTHDFAAFGRSPRAGGTTVRTVHDVDVRQVALRPSRAGAVAGTVVIIDVVADAFLHGMMRSLAAALVAVGTGSLDIEDVVAMLRGRVGQRNQAPAHGLHQWRVDYASERS